LEKKKREEPSARSIFKKKKERLRLQETKERVRRKRGRKNGGKRNIREGKRENLKFPDGKSHPSCRGVLLSERRGDTEGENSKFVIQKKIENKRRISGYSLRKSNQRRGFESCELRGLMGACSTGGTLIKRGEGTPDSGKDILKSVRPCLLGTCWEIPRGGDFSRKKGKGGQSGCLLRGRLRNCCCETGEEKRPHREALSEDEKKANRFLNTNWLLEEERSWTYLKEGNRTKREQKFGHRQRKTLGQT